MAADLRYSVREILQKILEEQFTRFYGEPDNRYPGWLDDAGELFDGSSASASDYARGKRLPTAETLKRVLAQRSNWEEVLHRTSRNEYRVLPCGVAVERKNQPFGFAYTAILPSGRRFMCTSSQLIVFRMEDSGYRLATAHEVKRYVGFVRSAFPDAKFAFLGEIPKTVS